MHLDARQGRLTELQLFTNKILAMVSSLTDLDLLTWLSKFGMLAMDQGCQEHW